MSGINCIFSDCRRYRYTWSLIWDWTQPRAAFVGLNPSTADESSPDPTVRRCIAYAKAWGFGGLLMLNLFAFRATDPRAMKREPAPIGFANDWHLQTWCRRVHNEGGVVVAAWGLHGYHMERAAQVRHLLRDVPLYYLDLTKCGAPKHPLYLRASLEPKPWERAA